MKTNYKSLAAVVVSVAVFGLLNTAIAQEAQPAKQTKPTKEVITKNLISNKQYVFYARYVTPMNGVQKYLTSEYTLTVLKDTVVSDLPYFGRAYEAPISPSDDGIKFTSVNFDYKADARNKGGWEITIKPKDARQVQQLFLTVFSNGEASLNVTSTNRQAISFSGYIAEKKLTK